MKLLAKTFFAMVIVASACTAALALIIPNATGKWPETWPKELEPLREQARTIMVAHGIQENHHDITFKTTDDLLKYWPHILKLRTPGSRLILEKAPHRYQVSGEALDSGIRVIEPANVSLSKPVSVQLDTRTEWPESAHLANGELAEYVTTKDGKFVPGTKETAVGFLFRARRDIVLVCDGKIVDLNRIPLPKNFVIEDRRFEQEKP